MVACLSFRYCFGKTQDWYSDMLFETVVMLGKVLGDWEGEAACSQGIFLHAFWLDIKCLFPVYCI